FGVHGGNSRWPLRPAQGRLKTVVGRWLNIREITLRPCPRYVIPSGVGGLGVLRRDNVRRLTSASLLPRKHAALPQHFFIELALQAVAQDKPRIRRKAEAEGVGHVFVQSPPDQIFARVRAFRPLQIFLEQGAGTLMDIEQHSAEPGFPGLSRTRVADLG